MTSVDANKLIPYKVPLQQKFYDLKNEPIECSHANTASIEWKAKPGNAATAARKIYKRHNLVDKQKIVETGIRGGEWQTLAARLGVNYKTAYRWIAEYRHEQQPLQCKRHKILTDEEQEQLLQWLEEKPLISLQELKEKIQRDYQKKLSVTTISNNLNGKIYTVKYLRYEPISMNNLKNKHKRANYVRDLIDFMEKGKQIIWIDETNFNLYWRKSRSWNTKNPNVCLMGGVSTTNFLLIASKRGSFELQDAQEWLLSLMNMWQELGNRLQDLVIVCDHTLHQNQLETVFENSPVSLHRLAPFSSMLNPIEFIWTKIKAQVKKAQLNTANAILGKSCDEHLVRLESIIVDAKAAVTTIDCELAIQQATKFYQRALKLQDMPVGL